MWPYFLILSVELFYLDVFMLGVLGAVCCGLTYVLLHLSGGSQNCVGLGCADCTRTYVSARGLVSRWAVQR